MALSLLATSIIILGYTAIFVGVAKLFLQKHWAKSSIKYHPQFILGAHFFTGAIIFTTTWVGTSLILGNLKESLFCTTALYLIAITYQVSKDKLQTLRWRECVLVGLVLILFAGISFGRALLPMPFYFVDQPELASPFAGFGVVFHSFRAGNLTEYIVSENTLPRISQHTGQALLASIPLLIRQTSAQLSLVLWMIMFVTFTATTLYGLSRSFILDRYRAIIPVAIVFLGNTVLSPFYSSTSDAENALLLATNIESVFGIGSFIVLMVLTYEHLTIERVTKAFLMLLLATSFIWNIFSGQMILLFILLIIFGLAVHRNQRQLRGVLIVVLGTCVSGAVLGAVLLGGMLAPATLVDKIPVPGLLEVHNNAYAPLALRFPRTGESGSRLKAAYFSQTDSTLTFTNAPAITPTNSLSSNVKKHPYLHMLAKLARSVQVVFFPLLGLAVSLLLIHRGYLQSPSKRFLYSVWVASVILFLVGWVISSCFTLYGYSWELSRFFYMGLTLSMLLLGTAIAVCVEKFPHMKVIWIFVVAFIMCGPTLELLCLHLAGNIYFEPVIEKDILDQLNADESRALSLPERFNFLITSHGMFGTHYNAK